MRKKFKLVSIIIILLFILVALISFVIYGYQYSIAQDTRYFYHCENTQIYEWDIQTDDDAFYVDCDDYYSGRKCKGSIESTTKLQQQQVAQRMCKSASDVIENNILSLNGKTSKCQNSYDHCYRIDTNNEDMGTYAIFSWSWEIGNTIKLKYSCQSSDRTADNQGGLVYRLSQFDTRMKCEKIPGQEDFNCGGLHTNPQNQGNEYVYEDAGQIEITYIDLLLWNKTGYDKLYVHTGCFGKYYADFNSDYVMIQDYITFPVDLIDECENTNECIEGISRDVYVEPIYNEIKWCYVLCMNDGTKGWYGDDCVGWNEGCGGNKCIYQPDGSCRPYGYTEIRKELVEPGYTKTEYHKIFDDNIYRECINGKCRIPSICGDGICDSNEDCEIDCIVTCASDVFECPDGSYVTRDANVDCQFPECPSCEDADWSPNANEICSYEEFTQISNCGNERVMTGTKNCKNKYLISGIVASLVAFSTIFFRKIYK